MRRQPRKTPYPTEITQLLQSREDSLVTLDGDLQVSKHPIEFTHGRKLNWPTNLTLLLLHAGAIAALFMFSWRAFIVALILHWIAVGFGISLGYHRLHTHQSYQAPLFIQYLFAIFGILTLEGGPIFSVGTHRINHAKSDQPGDPHSPHDGGWWSHAGWIMFGETNHNNTVLMSKFTPDLAKHRFYLWLNSYHWVPLAVLGAGLLWFGGLPMFLLGSCLRLRFGLPSTPPISSAPPIYGSPRCHTQDHC